jgi:phosphate:Na+ symporter
MVLFASILSLFAGLGVFLLGIRLISSHMQKLASHKITGMFGRMTGNRLAAVGLGAGASFALQSSTAATVLLLGLVNAGMIDLMQATLIIMGANVGTTFTVLIFAFGYLPVGGILSLAALAGVIMIMTAKKEKTISAGWIVAGFGLIFIGLGLMNGSMDFLKTSTAFSRFILSINHPFLLLFTGIVFASIAQSSSATTAVVITLAEAGLMPMTSAFVVIMGSNVGTCVTTMLAGIGASVNAKRTTVVHLLYNIAGVILFFPVILIVWSPLNTVLSKVLPPALAIAYFHILFNLLTTIVLMPFAKGLSALSERCIPAKRSAAKNKKSHGARIIYKSC